MTEHEVISLIRQEIRNQILILLFGQTGTAATVDTEDIANQYPGMDNIPARPKILPYGVSSIAPSGTLNLVGRVGNHTGNKVVLGHRDANRYPVQTGEVALYNSSGQVIYVSNGKIKMGAGGFGSPFVLGDVLKSLLSSLLSELATHTHPSPGAPPTDAAAFTGFKSNFVDNNKILSQIIAGE